MNEVSRPLIGKEFVRNLSLFAPSLCESVSAVVEPPSGPFVDPLVVNPGQRDADMARARTVRAYAAKGLTA